MLGWLGLPFEVVDHGIDESEYRDSNGKEMVKSLSLAKAYGGLGGIRPLNKNKQVESKRYSFLTDINRNSQEKALVIGSDLTVELNGKTYDKPKDLNDAKRILKVLSGKTHVIYCGVAVVDAKTEKAVVSVDSVEVKMKDYDEKIVDEYIKKFEVLDKGASYSIQFELPEYGSLVEKIDGNMTAIIGLPMEYLVNLLKEFEVTNLEDWRKICKEEMGYDG